jgi:hypothetical protein
MKYELPKQTRLMPIISYPDGTPTATPRFNSRRLRKNYRDANDYVTRWKNSEPPPDSSLAVRTAINGSLCDFNFLNPMLTCDLGSVTTSQALQAVKKFGIADSTASTIYPLPPL